MTKEHEARRLDEALNRVRQRHHRMGPDVPFWVQDVMDTIHDTTVSFWACIWRCTLFLGILVAVWDIYALGRGLPLVGLSHAILLGVMIGIWAGGWAFLLKRNPAP